MKKTKLAALVCVLFLAFWAAAQTERPPENGGQTPVLPMESYPAEEYEGLEIELTFWSPSCNQPYGLWGPSAPLTPGEPKVELLGGTAAAGDVAGYHEIKTWPGFEARTFIAYEGPHTHDDFQTVYELISTRDDIYTYRGVRVGTSLAELLAAYPDLGLDLAAWQAKYQASGEAGELMYTPEEYRGSLAPGLYFTIEDGCVSKLELRYVPQRHEF